MTYDILIFSYIGIVIYQFAEKATFVRLIKNVQMQGARNPEEYKTLGRSCGKVFYPKTGQTAYRGESAMADR
jgi:hypothetical protein